MSLKWKPKQMRQKEYYEHQLQERLTLLAVKGIKGAAVNKDPLVKKLKADLRAVNKRLRLIAATEKRTAEMAKIKAEKAAAPKEEKAGAKAEKPKKAPEEGKAKKPKAEKKAGPPKEKGAGKAPKPAEPAEPSRPNPLRKRSPNKDPGRSGSERQRPPFLDRGQILLFGDVAFDVPALAADIIIQDGLPESRYRNRVAVVETRLRLDGRAAVDLFRLALGTHAFFHASSSAGTSSAGVFGPASFLLRRCRIASLRMNSI